MKNDRYFKLRIPFGTKGHIKQSFDSIVIKGDAIFVFDRQHNRYIDEYLEIEKGNFRLTDLKMITPTDYYKKNKWIKESHTMTKCDLYLQCKNSSTYKINQCNILHFKTMDKNSM